MHFRNLKKTNQDLYMSDPIDMDKDGNPLTLTDIISDGKDLAEDLELKIQSEKLIELINGIEDPREREIIILRYGLNNKKPLTQREVASRLNISRSYVSRIEKKVLQNIKIRF
ncbi:MAG: sigma-70 family RNA polymerase sigma factor [Clostridiales bacterium]|nr:sigma-70 family RNA polymerase sigma factor [Clostridiales bacterium]